MTESGKSLEEMSSFLLNDAENRKQARVHQLRAQQATAQKISELVADPRWEVYGRHVEAIRDLYTRKRDAASAKLLGKVLPRDEYVEAAVDMASHAAAVRALNEALTVAKTLIEHGEKAVEALKILDNQQKGANNGAA